MPNRKPTISRKSHPNTLWGCRSFGMHPACLYTPNSSFPLKTWYDQKHNTHTVALSNATWNPLLHNPNDVASKFHVDTSWLYASEGAYRGAGIVYTKPTSTALAAPPCIYCTEARISEKRQYCIFYPKNKHETMVYTICKIPSTVWFVIHTKKRWFAF